MMKNLLSILVLNTLCGAMAFAQPTTEIFPDFTYDDIEGNTHNLQSYLDEGKTVVIDVFATWCGICNASIGGMEELYSTLGQGGDESLVLLSFERDPSTSNEASWAMSNGVETPIITGAEDIIAEVWNDAYQPRYYVICPDGTWEQPSPGGIYNDPQPLIDLSEDCEIVNSIDEQLKSQISLAGPDGSGQLRMELSGAEADYQVFDLTGRLHSNGGLMNGVNLIDVTQLKSGIYFISLTRGSERLTLRFGKS